MVLKAAKNEYDSAILLSSDTDLIPAMDGIKEFGKRVEYVGFFHQQRFGILKTAASSWLL
jgi:uncharacterized LabA/DUF88 family protein